MKKINFRKIAYVFIVGILLITIIGTTAYLAQYQYNKWQEDKLLSEVKEQKQKQKQEEEKKQEQKEETETDEQKRLEEPDLVKEKPKEILAKYKDLYKENNDMYGWIKIEDTIIDYPVMFTPDDPNFYEDKNWNKEVCYKKVGTSIFIDGRTTEETENIIVYGHNMKNATMFGSLKKYKEKEYYEAHKFIQFDTIYQEQTYEIISVSKDRVYYDEKEAQNDYLFYMNIELDSEKDFNKYIKHIKSNAYYDIEATAHYGEQIITLCTCDKWTTDGRLLIVAKKIQ